MVLTNSKKNKLLEHTGGSAPKRETSGGAHLCGLAPRQQCSEETSHRWCAVGEHCVGFNWLGNRTDNDV